VEKLAAERKQIQDQINKLTAVRKVYLAEQEKKLQEQMSAVAGAAPGAAASAAAPAFERAVIDAVRAEAAKK
jgi:acetolactate synthase small subunit